MCVGGGGGRRLASEQWLRGWPLGCAACFCPCLTAVRCVSQLMRNLLGTHLGHSAIYNMCRIMEDRRVRAGPGRCGPCGVAFSRGLSAFLSFWGGCSGNVLYS